MSDSFTITKDNWQQLDKMEELRLAYSERSFIAGRGFRRYIWNGNSYEWSGGDGTSADWLTNNLPDHGKGFNAQCVLFFSEIQSFVLEFYSWVSKKEEAFYRDQVDGEQPLSLGFDTFKDFCEYCGGSLYHDENDYGFRYASETDEDGRPVIQRSTNSPCQAGEILGGWILDDLRLAFTNWMATRFVQENYDYRFELVFCEQWANPGGVFYGEYAAAVAASIYLDELISTNIYRLGWSYNDSYFGWMSSCGLLKPTCKIGIPTEAEKLFIFAEAYYATSSASGDSGLNFTPSQIIGGYFPIRFDSLEPMSLGGGWPPTPAGSPDSGLWDFSYKNCIAHWNFSNSDWSSQ